MSQPDLFDAYASYFVKTESNPEIRVPDLVECVMRNFGYRRGQPRYGKQGDIIAARYGPRGWNWCGVETGDPDPEPLWLRQGRRNETAADVIVVFMVLFALGGMLAVWTTVAESRFAQEQQTRALLQTGQTQYGPGYAQYSPTPQYAQYQQNSPFGRPNDSRMQMYTER